METKRNDVLPRPGDSTSSNVSNSTADIIPSAAADNQAPAAPSGDNPQVPPDVSAAAAQALSQTMQQGPVPQAQLPSGAVTNQPGTQAQIPPAQLNSQQTPLTQQGTQAQPQQPQNRQQKRAARKTSKDFDHKKCRPLTLESKVYSMAVTCFDEQLPNGWAYVQGQIRGADVNFVQIEGICHDRDMQSADGTFWNTAPEKVHYHIILRFTDRKTRVRVKQILDYLGIYFRPRVDDDLWNNHGVESVSNFAGMSLYLTHDSKNAIDDGKEQYFLNEVISNMSMEQLEAVREGYLDINFLKRKPSTDDLMMLDRQAFDLGYELKDYDDWFGQLPFVVRDRHSMKTFEDSYHRGVEKHLDENDAVVRCCIFIHGAPNVGKSYSVEMALKNLGCRILRVEGGHTGKFDRLKPSTDAIVINDDTVSNLLALADNRMCYVYRRGSNNPLWCGRYLVVTSNDDFETFCQHSGIKTRTAQGGETKRFKAVRSRFFLCHIAKNMVAGGGPDGTYPKPLHSVELDIDGESPRGTVAEQEERLAMFRRLKNETNEIMAGYTPEEQHVDYTQDFDQADVGLRKFLEAFHPEDLVEDGAGLNELLENSESFMTNAAQSYYGYSNEMRKHLIRAVGVLLDCDPVKLDAALGPDDFDTTYRFFQKVVDLYSRVVASRKKYPSAP